MRAHAAAAVLAAALAGPAALCAHEPSWERPGAMVEVSIDVEGGGSPLYAAPDGSGRYYFEARRGARYSIRLANRTHQRLGVVLQVDGLNVISGERPARWPGSDPGRMYVLDPWDSTEVKGWRTSLDEVRRFTFVDEERSYAARSGQANSKMGWVEIAVYRERGRTVGGYGPRRPDPSARDRAGEDRDEPAAESAPPASAPPAARRAPESRTEGMADGGRAYPGTGWGQRTDDHVLVVDFEPERSPAERITLRYEYASGLRALGIDPLPRWTRDRLRERDRGQTGFAKPPAW
ncbi:MAG TPA: hypothetical protein VFQ51_05620 [Vicinamibacteria bacterium]|nr:hypothetical protein [Vicinamibacteria bacterium]